MALLVVSCWTDVLLSGSGCHSHCHTFSMCGDNLTSEQEYLLSSRGTYNTTTKEGGAKYAFTFPPTTLKGEGILTGNWTRSIQRQETWLTKNTNLYPPLLTEVQKNNPPKNGLNTGGLKKNSPHRLLCLNAWTI